MGSEMQVTLSVAHGENPCRPLAYGEPVKLTWEYQLPKGKDLEALRMLQDKCGSENVHVAGDPPRLL